MTGQAREGLGTRATPQPAAASAVAALPWWLVPTAIGMLGRAWSTAMLVWANGLRAHPIGNPFTTWDGLWYLSIAANGYHANPIAGPLRDIAFFPVWPLVIRGSTALGWSAAAISPIVAAGFFVLAGVLVWRLLADRLGEATATAGVALLAFSPASYAMSMNYSEPLFICLASAALLHTRTPQRAFATAAAMATRITGSGLVLVALLRAAAARGRERTEHLLVAGAGVAAFAAWWTFLAILMHDPMGFLKGSPSWQGTTGAWAIADAILHPEIHWAGFLGVYAIVVVGAIRLLRADLELGAYSLAALALALLPGGLVSSMPRYAIGAFPAFAGIALLVGDRVHGRARTVALVALVVVSALAQALFAYWAFVDTRAP